MSNTLEGLFKEQLENECLDLKEKCSLKRRGDYLIWWYFVRLGGMSHAEIDEIVCDGAADLGIDAIWIDSDSVVHFYSFKNPESVESAFPGGEVDKTLAGLDIILARRHHTIANAELKGRVEEIYQSVPAGYKLHLVTSGTGVGQESRIKLNAFIDRLGGPSSDFFTWTCEDLKRLQDIFYRRNLPTVEEPIDFTLEFPPYQVRSANHDSYIFHSPANVLANLYGKHREQLLQQNIRVHQGDNATNSLILSSAIGVESGNFLHYNNGITFLCESAAWDGFTRNLTLRKAQVVNGGQTIRILHAASARMQLKSDVGVSVRVITSQGDKEFANNVAVNLNNQNRVEPSFLRSNDPRIVQLASALLSMGWYLERRENEVEGFSEMDRRAIENQIDQPLKDRTIRLKEGAQAYVATFQRMPELAKKNPKRIFLGASDGGYFDRVFNEHLTAAKFVESHRLASAIEGYVRRFNSLKRRRDRLSDSEVEYNKLLGPVLSSHSHATLDQIVPQSAVFLTAITFEIFVRMRSNQLADVCSSLESGDYTSLNEFTDQLINFADSEHIYQKSWPTLLKSQSFFDQFANHIRGIEAPDENLTWTNDDLFGNWRQA